MFITVEPYSFHRFLSTSAKKISTNRWNLPSSKR